MPDSKLPAPKPPSRRVMYLAGPGNVIGSYEHWKAGRPDPSQLSRTFSGQFFEVCRDFGARALVVAWPREPGRLREKTTEIIHAPIPFFLRKGLLFHLGQILYGLWIVWLAARFRPTLLVASEGTYWFMLRMLATAGIPVVPALFCTLWPRFERPRRMNRLALRLARPLFAREGFAVLSMSHRCTEQARALAGGDGVPVVEFLPSYEPDCPAPSVGPGGREPHAPLRLLFAGRVERNKGVFDLLQVARTLRAEEGDLVRIDVCGDGSALDSLRAAVREAGLDGCVRLHGHCDRHRLNRQYAECDAVIVPTRTDFVEGFNQVVLEGVLAGKPVITSTVCPAMDYVRDAVLEVAPNDVAGYTARVRELATDDELYHRKASAACLLRDRFFEPGNSWADAFRHILHAALQGRRPESRPIRIGLAGETEADAAFTEEGSCWNHWIGVSRRL